MTPEADPAIVELYACDKCGATWQTYFAGCPYCGHERTTLVDTPGHGQVYSWVEVHVPLHDESPEVPYTVVTVKLDSGAKVFASYGEDIAPHIGQRVDVRDDAMGALIATVTTEPGDKSVAANVSSEPT